MNNDAKVNKIVATGGNLEAGVSILGLYAKITSLLAMYSIQIVFFSYEQLGQCVSLPHRTGRVKYPCVSPFHQKIIFISHFHPYKNELPVGFELTPIT